MKHNQLRHVFVEHMPESLDEGVLYVSIPFATAAHRCCCGCGNEVFTPISPTDWTLIFDGKSISLDPSIGNWGFHCRSHYWILDNKVRWAEEWSDDRVESARTYERNSKAAYYDESVETSHPDELSTFRTVEKSQGSGMWSRMKKWLGIY